MRFVLTPQKGQSAIEYLMTYGWMLLVVSIVGAAIFALAGGQEIESINGFTGTDVQIDTMGVTTDDELEMILRNADSNTVTINEITVSDGERYNVYNEGDQISVGADRAFKVNHIRQGGDTGELDVTINYDSGVLSNLVISGSITGSLEMTEKAALTGNVAPGASPSFNLDISEDFEGDHWIPVNPERGVENGYNYLFDEQDDAEYFGDDGFYIMKYEPKPWHVQDQKFPDRDASSSRGVPEDGWTEDHLPLSIAGKEEVPDDGKDAPWRNIALKQQYDEDGNDVGAYEVCDALNDRTDDFDIHLMTNREYMTVARQIEQTTTNWVSDPVEDSGEIIQGYTTSDDWDQSPLNASTDDEDKKYRILEHSDNDYDTADDIPANQARVMDLANNHKIWDFGGNLRQWIYPEDNAGASDGIFDQTNPDGVKYEKDPAVVNRDTNGVGADYNFNESYPAQRGAYHATGSDEGGIFKVYDTEGDGAEADSVGGFRCTAVPT